MDVAWVVLEWVTSTHDGVDLFHRVVGVYRREEDARRVATYEQTRDVYREAQPVSYYEEYYA